MRLLQVLAQTAIFIFFGGLFEDRVLGTYYIFATGLAFIIHGWTTK